ncbi:uncharacterized protein LOC113389082 [Ctenocephalides felis]|uniref:uncharacterized protein LOC113389081 n=1 Tax=Ctenocephalides felis TaxID=7515 RepID=UPI000E6E38FE|nr:uncharacterized protein LOC113389081 [Ctenocephalides felis]XP_026481926.1 uncharacterized protein LOC113389081 [Ctenocephalides felis]XP_026481927.1 uncharacterized protein LOC113389082 [Ctenocephalides felis]XP_026481928.1 uncharacterized protein LOC113389082 [Ctenocephalides felis]
MNNIWYFVILAVLMNLVNGDFDRPVQDDVIVTDVDCTTNEECQNLCQQEEYEGSSGLCFSKNQKCICKKNVPRPAEDIQLVEVDFTCLYDNECKHKCKSLNYNRRGATCEIGITGQNPKKCKCPQLKGDKTVQIFKKCNGIHDCLHECEALGYSREKAVCSYFDENNNRCKCEMN